MSTPEAVRIRLHRTAAALVTVLALTSCTAGAKSSAGSGAAPTSAGVPADVAGCAAFAPDGKKVGGGDGVPAVRLPCLVGGGQVTLDDLGGRPVLINLWASWCAPCREEMPMLQAAYVRDGNRVGFLGVNTEDTPAGAVGLITDLGVTYAHVVDREKKLLSQLAAPGLPVTLAVAADGRVVDRQIGQMSAARLDELVSRLAADAAAPTP